MIRLIEIEPHTGNKNTRKWVLFPKKESNSYLFTKLLRFVMAR